MAAIDQRLMKAHVGVVGAFDTKQLVLFFLHAERSTRCIARRRYWMARAAALVRLFLSLTFFRKPRVPWFIH